MPRLSLIEPSEPFDFLSAYIRMMERWIQRNGSTPETPIERMQYAYLTVKAVNALHADREHLGAPEDIFNNYEDAVAILSQLTPAQMVTTFPPTKSYDGARYECKDYFSTMEAVRTYPADKPIGSAIHKFLWDYMNSDLMSFYAGFMCSVSELHRQETGKELVEEFFEQMGTPLTTYRLCKDPASGKEFLQGNDGSIVPVAPKLRVVT